jgi:hypothetical protein
MSRSGNYVNNRDIEFATSNSHNVSTKEGRYLGRYRHWGIFNWELLELVFDDFGDGHFGIKGDGKLVVICGC